MKHFFFSKLDSRRCFRCLNSINFNKAETKLTSAGHHNIAAYAALSAGAGVTACPVAHCRPRRAACQPLEKSRLFKHWLFSMVGWLTEAPHHRTRAHTDVRRRERRWFQLCLFYGMVLVLELDPLGRSWLSQLFFWWMRKPTALDSKPCHVTGKQWLHAH